MDQTAPPRFAARLNAFKIDGESFRHDCVDHLLQRGDLIEWTLMNTSMAPISRS